MTFHSNIGSCDVFEVPSLLNPALKKFSYFCHLPSFAHTTHTHNNNNNTHNNNTHNNNTVERHLSNQETINWSTRPKERKKKNLQNLN